MSERILVRKIEPHLWQWREATNDGQWLRDEFYTGDINLLREAAHNRLSWLILEGQQVVTQRVELDVKDNKQLYKTLPYEVEDSIVESVDDLHFAYGQPDNQGLAVAYADFDWLDQSIRDLESAGTEVQRCSADYLLLPWQPNSWTLLLENDILMAVLDSGVGFTLERSLAPAYLADLNDFNPPQQIFLYGETQESLEQLQTLLPTTLTSNIDLVVHTQVAGFWDLMNLTAAPVIDFRSGKLARKLPFAKWWNDFKWPMMAGAAAFVLAVATALMGLQKAESERKRIITDTDAIYRQVVPSGNINNPLAQLRGLLGQGGGAEGASNLVFLLSGVAPAVKSIDGVTLRSLRYTQESKQLQINLEANSFDAFESLRNKLSEKGLKAEIKSAQVSGDKHQAQLRVSEAG